MPHTPIFARLSRLRRVAHAADGLGLSTSDALERERAGLSRRGFLAGADSRIMLARVVPTQIVTDDGGG